MNDMRLYLKLYEDASLKTIAEFIKSELSSTLMKISLANYKKFRKSVSGPPNENDPLRDLLQTPFNNPNELINFLKKNMDRIIHITYDNTEFTRGMLTSDQVTYHFKINDPRIKIFVLVKELPLKNVVSDFVKIIFEEHTNLYSTHDPALITDYIVKNIFWGHTLFIDEYDSFGQSIERQPVNLTETLIKNCVETIKNSPLLTGYEVSTHNNGLFVFKE